MRVRLTSIARVVRRIIGVPDYDRYVAHMQRRHPDEKPLSCEEFGREAMARRYNQPGNRCC